MRTAYPIPELNRRRKEDLNPPNRDPALRWRTCFSKEPCDRASAKPRSGCDWSSEQSVAETLRAALSTASAAGLAGPVANQQARRALRFPPAGACRLGSRDPNVPEAGPQLSETVLGVRLCEPNKQTPAWRRP